MEFALFLTEGKKIGKAVSRILSTPQIEGKSNHSSRSPVAKALKRSHMKRS